MYTDLRIRVEDLLSLQKKQLMESEEKNTLTAGKQRIPNRFSKCSGECRHHESHSEEGTTTH